MALTSLKQRVKEHWEKEVCGSRNGVDCIDDRREYFKQIDRVRYEQEPMILDFARFDQARGKKVLEVGLGAGADFVRWVRGGAIAYGRDLTQAAVNTVRERLRLEVLAADVE